MRVIPSDENHKTKLQEALVGCWIQQISARNIRINPNKIISKKETVDDRRIESLRFQITVNAVTTHTTKPITARAVAVLTSASLTDQVVAEALAVIDSPLWLVHVTNSIWESDVADNLGSDAMRYMPWELAKSDSQSLDVVKY